MRAQELQQIIEEAPGGVVLHHVMAQDAAGFVDIAVTAAPGDEVLYQYRNSGIDAQKTTVVAPVNRIQVSVDLQQTRSRVGSTARFHGRYPAEAKLRQGFDRRAVDSVPGRNQGRNETLAEFQRQRLPAEPEFARDSVAWKAAAKLEFTLTRRGMIGVRVAVL